MIDLPQRLPGKGVVGGDLAVVRAYRRRHLARGFPPDHITGGPDMGDGGAQGAINAHGSRHVYLHARPLQADLLRIGASPGGHQQLFGGEGPAAPMSLHDQRHPCTSTSHGTYLRPCDDLESLLAQNLGQGFSDFRLVASQDARSAGDQGHLAAKAGKHLSQFEGNVATAQNEQRAGQLCQLQLLLAGQQVTREIRRLGETWNVGDERR